jgi:hypothetical protein
VAPNSKLHILLKKKEDTEVSMFSFLSKVKKKGIKINIAKAAMTESNKKRTSKGHIGSSLMRLHC